MTSDAKPTERLSFLPDNRAIKIKNVTCAYCGGALDKNTATEDHVIGRRFVPKGKFNGQWNLIVRACLKCNGEKADLEDDISAITLQPDLTGDHGHKDATAIAEARRKAANSMSRRTRKAVKQSHEAVSVKLALGPQASITFNLTSPAQIDQKRAFALARLQLMAFFYWLTFNESTGRGGFWRGGCYLVMEVMRGDWGNPVMRAFADAVAQWEPRVYASTADGFFKIVIRRHPDAECWSWALEWNLNMRVVGFFGDEAVARAIAASFPALEMQSIQESPDRGMAYRTETRLAEEDDRLFFLRDEFLPEAVE